LANAIAKAARWFSSKFSTENPCARCFMQNLGVHLLKSTVSAWGFSRPDPFAAGFLGLGTDLVLNLCFEVVRQQ
jgi:hypothetical protein